MDDILQHHGVIGQKWGVRRYQNKDGSLTSLGKRHFAQMQMGQKRTEAAQKQDAAKSGKSPSSYSSHSRSNSSNSTDSEPTYGGYYGGGGSGELSEEEKKRRAQWIEEQLVKAFGGETESLRYVKTNGNDSDPDKTTYIYTSPIDGTKTVYTLATSQQMFSAINKDLKTLEEGKKRTESSQKQDTARKVQEKKTADEERKRADLAKKRTEAARKQDTATSFEGSRRQRSQRIEERDKEIDAQMADIESKYENLNPRIFATKSTTTSNGSNTTTVTSSVVPGYTYSNVPKTVVQTYFSLYNEKKELEKERSYLRYLDHAFPTDSKSNYTVTRRKNLKHGGDMMDDILVHYGVLGMKWGIRRYQNADGTLTEAGKARVNKKYSKATNKLRRIDRKLEKQNVKKNKIAEKKFKAEYNAQKPPGMFTSNRAIAKRDRAAYNANNKYRKAEWKSEKTYNKASKWVRKMEKKFKNVDLSSVNKNDLEFAQQYAAMIFSDTRRSSHASITKR